MVMNMADGRVFVGVLTVVVVVARQLGRICSVVRRHRWPRDGPSRLTANVLLPLACAAGLYGVSAVNAAYWESVSCMYVINLCKNKGWNEL